MTCYEKYQMMVDVLNTRASKGIIPAFSAIETQNSFNEWKSKTSIIKATKNNNEEIQSNVYKCSSN